MLKKISVTLSSILLLSACGDDAVEAPYGSWESPITAELTTQNAVGLRSVRLDGDDLYWIESRPEEGGRRAIVKRDADGNVTDAIPEEFSSRTRVHEYGGGSYFVENGVIYFSNHSDQKLYRYNGEGTPEALTTDGYRYADCIMDTNHNQLICTQEDHTEEGEPVNTLVAVSLDGGGKVRTLFSGTDFVSSSALSPDGNSLVWITWDHPNMNWDDTKMWKARVTDQGSLSGTSTIIQRKSLSVQEPRWNADGELYYISDPTGWWNFQKFEDDESRSLTRKQIEFGKSGALGAHSWAFYGDDQIIAKYESEGTSHLATVDLGNGAVEEIETPYVSISKVYSNGNKVYILGATTTTATEIAEYDDGDFITVRKSQDALVDDSYISEPEAITFPNLKGEATHAFYYAPKNADYEAPEDTLPPTIVRLHGGPVGATNSAFRMSRQFWTSRGFAIIDINYGGSTGYGRSYRERLRGQWGIVDIDDTKAAIDYIVDQGLADREKLLIAGGSAGGYSVLVALSQHDIFAAGANYFGISDLEVLARDTHKYESRFLDSLIGRYPEDIDIYKDRSPINHLDGFSSPLITFQGLLDEVVPPNQSELIVSALREKGVPVAYYPYEGEYHGFGKKENIIHSLESELVFYGKILGFTPAGELPEIHIDNFDG
ncbi:MAG: prolyl oligopeptidase family serine peptidase [Emcibacteraceae bacterium]|nr:prolyl oligopeptidase family serine peptidase [Emcibacteraceae bacterium]MDG1995343.1 prolyl oligopeptidase family serine peptidase [Emcibacteraceae bacterium]